MENHNYSLGPCTDAELKSFNDDLQDIIAKHGVEMRIVPVFVPNPTTNKFEVDSNVVVYKKVQLVPKTNEGSEPKEGPQEAPVQEGPAEEAPQVEEATSPSQTQA